jgi:hypothetical protein
MCVETYDVSSILDWEFVIKTEAAITHFMTISARYVSPGQNISGVLAKTAPNEYW